MNLIEDDHPGPVLVERLADRGQPERVGGEDHVVHVEADDPAARTRATAPTRPRTGMATQAGRWLASYTIS